jgi:hypothetical protein
MDGNQGLQTQAKDFNDPFNAGQMIGMLVMLSFLEKHPNIPREAIDKLKWTCATNAEAYMDKPAEDIHLFIENLVKEMK